MKFNLIEHYKNISNHLLSQYRLSSSYGHRGSKGQIREDFLTRTLQEMSHDHIKLIKGEICDSSGRRSPEFDIIVSYLSSTIRLFSSDINHVIPIETVLSVIEVKSILSKEGISKFNEDLKVLNSFERFYLPSPTYEQICKIKGTKEYTLIGNRAISPKERVFEIFPVRSGIVAFEAPKTETVQEWMSEIETELNFLYIFVIGRFFVYRDLNNKWYISERGDESFALFASLFSEFLTNTNDREYHIQADSKRYIDLAAKDVKD